MEFVGGGCTLTNAKVEAEGLLADSHHEDQHYEDQHHEDEHHDEHEDEHHEDAHAEFEAKYVFNCTDADKLTSVSTSFFAVWPGIEEIETVFLSGDHQLSVELTASDPSFEIK